jgi:hypothetical protein
VIYAIDSRQFVGPDLRDGPQISLEDRIAVAAAHRLSRHDDVAASTMRGNELSGGQRFPIAAQQRRPSSPPGCGYLSAKEIPSLSAELAARF